MKIAVGLLLALSVSIVCRLGLPLPAPLALTGAVLVLAMTAGYELVDRNREALHRENCGGPDGRTKSARGADRQLAG